MWTVSKQGNLITNSFDYGKLIGTDKGLEELDNVQCTICGQGEKRMSRLYFEDENTEITCSNCLADIERIQHLL